MSRKKIECQPMPAGRGGWSEWVFPLMKGYRMQCCDCGLIHEMQFRTWRQVTPADANGEWLAEPIEDGRVEFRARRARG